MHMLTVHRALATVQQSAPPTWYLQKMYRFILLVECVEQQLGWTALIAYFGSRRQTFTKFVCCCEITRLTDALQENKSPKVKSKQQGLIFPEVAFFVGLQLRGLTFALGCY
jgi:hypothetical protein